MKLLVPSLAAARRLAIVIALAPLTGAAGSTGWVTEDAPRPLTAARSYKAVQAGPEALPNAAIAEGETAILLNAALPFSSEANPAASPFLFKALDAAHEARALDCLTEAVYYEAAWEPLPGQQAVAQVVLNRVRHPAYPNSVCGVVYQGSERSTGCQFTFTCDGSLGRLPNPRAWERARTVAAQALAGQVAPEIGRATHYHANYVFPYWAPRLLKVAQVGTHVFYRFGGAGNASNTLAQAYTGLEPGATPVIEEVAVPVAAPAVLEAVAPEPVLLVATLEPTPASHATEVEATPEVIPTDTATPLVPESAPPVVDVKPRSWFGGGKASRGRAALADVR